MGQPFRQVGSEGGPEGEEFCWRAASRVPHSGLGVLECDLWQSLAPSWGWGGREDVESVLHPSCVYMFSPGQDPPGTNLEKKVQTREGMFRIPVSLGS